MKKEVHPIIVAAALLLVLVGILAAYWRGLGPEQPLVWSANPDDKYNSAARRLTAEEGNPDEMSDTLLGAQKGVAGVFVSTLAGRPDPGYVDGPAPAARFDGPAAVAVGADGAVYVADSRNHAIRKISPAGQVSTVAGRPVPGHFGGYADGPSHTARFCAPAGVAVLPDGGIVVADTGNHRLRRIARDGTVSTLAGCATPPDELGQAGGGYRDGPALQAQFRFPTGLAVDAEGAIYIADSGNSRVRRLAGGLVSTVPTDGGVPRAPTAVLADHGASLLASDSFRSRRESPTVWSGTKSGPLSRLSLTDSVKGVSKPPLRLRAPAGLARTARPDDPPPPVGRKAAFFFIDADSHCLDWSGDDEHMPTEAAGESGTPGYVDGPGDVARFCTPAGLAAIPGGTLYIADFGNNCIRKAELGRWWSRDLATRRGQ